MGNKFQKLKEENLMEEELHVTQRTEPSWAIETDAKLVDLEDRCKRYNLRFEGIMEHENESWQDFENKIYDLLENKLKMDIENVVIE